MRPYLSVFASLSFFSLLSFPVAHVIAVTGEIVVEEIDVELSSSGSIVSSSSSEASSEISVSSSSASLQPSVRITELIANPAGLDTQNEWIEVTNRGGDSETLAGYSLKRGTTVFRFPDEILPPDSSRIFTAPATKLSLPNEGGALLLLHNEVEIQRVTYPALPEGVSYAMEETSGFRPQCLPTPEQPNTFVPVDASILRSDPATVGIGSLSVNLETAVYGISVSDVLCHFDYGDGFTSESCNPPAHTFKDAGFYTVKLTVIDYCSNTIEQIATFQVLPEPEEEEKPDQALFEATSSKESSENSCVPSAFTGVFLSEIHPDPTGTDAGNEWIELFALTPGLSLCGWKLDDGDGVDGAISLDGSSFGTGIYLVFQKGISLKNNGEMIRLLAPSQKAEENAIADAVYYGPSQTGMSYAKTEHVWTWQPPTRQKPNQTSLHDSLIPQAPSSGIVIISEIYPRPLTGEENDLLHQEWVELFNAGTGTVNLKGWMLDDDPKTGKPKKLPELYLKPQMRVVLTGSLLGITLNDGGEVLSLTRPDGTVISMVSYPKVERGISYSFYEQNWCSTNIVTPNNENSCELSFQLKNENTNSKNKNIVQYKNNSPSIQQKIGNIFPKTKYILPEEIPLLSGSILASLHLENFHDQQLLSGSQEQEFAAQTIEKSFLIRAEFIILILFALASTCVLQRKRIYTLYKGGK